MTIFGVAIWKAVILSGGGFLVGVIFGGAWVGCRVDEPIVWDE